MRVNEEEKVIIFNKKELEALDIVKDMIFEIIFDLRGFNASTSVNDVMGELWEMKRKGLDRIEL